MSKVRGKSATAMSRTKKPSKLSADERAFLTRICSLNEEETEKLTIEEMIAYLNIMHKIDPRWLRDAFEESFIDRGLTNSEVIRLLERAKWKQYPAACVVPSAPAVRFMAVAIFLTCVLAARAARAAGRGYAAHRRAHE